MHSVVRRLTAVAAAVFFMSGLIASQATAAAPTWSHHDVDVCGPASAGTAACDSVARVLFQNGQQFVARSPQDLGRIAKPAASVSFAAAQLRTAYGITGAGDPSKVIAIVDAYDNPNAYSHLTTYRDSMNLNASYPMGDCSSSLSSLTSGPNPCFAKVNQSGGTSYPTANSGWATEIDLDLQAASAICPDCSILLVEANSASFADLGAAVTYASTVDGVRAISNSYSSNGDAPGSLNPQWDQAATTSKGIAVMASTGDGGYGVGFPASATYVLGVGGTTLQVDGSGARSSETAWSGSGSGCSSYNVAPSWQVISGSPCGTRKAIADLSADADPNSGLQIYTTYNNTTTWWIFGGTSLSSPIMGALYAMQGGYGPTTSYPTASEYAWSAASYYDVTSGSNGRRCRPSVLCNAGTGWDGPTGLGSIQMGSVTQTATSISVTPADASVPAGGTQSYTAQELDQNGSPMQTQPTFTWKFAGVGSSITSTGPQTADFAAGSSLGSFTVTATPNDSVTPGTTPGSVVPASISVTPPSSSMVVGDLPLQLTATALDTTGGSVTNQPVFNWSVSSGGSITSTGTQTADFTTTTAGTYTVTASYGGVVSNAAQITVTAPATSGDFSISVSPGSRSIKSGSSTSYTITVTRTNNFTGSVSFSVDVAPSSSTIGASPSPTTTTGTTSTVNVTTNGTPKGTYSLTITGTSGTLSHSTTVSLKVR